MSHDQGDGKELEPGRHFDRRALLQRTRRSPIRPRRSSENARTAADAAGLEAKMFAREFMRVDLQERPV
jgi:hypothetical protein